MCTKEIFVYNSYNIHVSKYEFSTVIYLFAFWCILEVSLSLLSKYEQIAFQGGMKNGGVKGLCVCKGRGD